MIPDLSTEPRLLPVLERAEATALVDFARSASPRVAARLGIGLRQEGDLVALRTPGADVLNMNRVCGAGLDAPVDIADLLGLIPWFVDAGVRRFFLQPNPYAEPDDLPDRLRAHGFSHYNNWMRLYRGVDPCPEVSNRFVVEQIGPAAAPDFAQVVTTSFALPESVLPWLTDFVGRSDWLHYLAYDGHTPVAAAAMHLQGRTAWFGFAATAASHRRQGAQSGLIARRIADARASGCDLLVVETAENLPDRPAPSFINLQRLGFQVAYRRPNYLWKQAEIASGSSH